MGGGWEEPLWERTRLRAGLGQVIEMNEEQEELREDFGDRI